MIKFLLVSAFTIICLGSLTAQEKLSAGKQIPVIAWSGIPAQETSVEKFTELKEMGITINLCNYPDVASVEKALDVASQVGLKLITSCPELKTDCENTVRRLMKHPALEGYFLRDEPIQKDFADLGEWAQKIESIDNHHFCFVNLIAAIHPTKTEALGTKSYADYVQTLAQTIPIKQISFDFYPVINDGIHERWYEGLEIVSAHAKKLELPFWGFALASSYNELHPEPTVAALRLQMFSNLAYGAQGLEYWSYRMSQGLRNAPVGLDGKRSVIYDRIKQVNAEIQNLAGVFAGAKVVAVRHTGTVIPRGTTRLTTLPQAIKVFETFGNGAIVSQLENNGHTFFVVINRDLENTMPTVIYGDDSLKRVLNDGTVISAGKYANRFEIEPGDLTVFMFPTEKKGGGL